MPFLLSADTIRRLNDALVPAGSEERSLLASISNHVAARGAATQGLFEFQGGERC
jgi:hypothetical protein